LAVRIYALAKELKLDSKDLVDICTKAGVPGKGSALASLTEEEAEKVKAFLRGGGTAKSKPAAKAAPLAPQRPAEPARTGKMPVIVTPKPPAPTARPKAAEPAEETAPETEEAPIAAKATATQTAVAAPPETTSRRPGPLAGAMGREKYIGPAGTAMGKIPTVGGGRETKPTDRKRADGPSSTERARPAVKLAPLPKTSRSLEPAAPDEPPAQKPDLRLPADISAPENKAPSRWLRTCGATSARLRKKRRPAA
jgi:translation initiation factor IF-2